jgi:hypothetical protein
MENNTLADGDEQRTRGDTDRVEEREDDSEHRFDIYNYTYN